RGGIVRNCAAPSWASVWVPRTWVLVGGVGGVLSWGLARRGWVRPVVAGRVAVLGAATAILAWPAALHFQARGTMEILMVDVGQGDAIAIRTPGNRWILVDAGPPARSGRSAVASALARRGVSTLDLVVLTHPDMDHMGAAAEVLEAFTVRAVADPGRAAAKEAYVSLLETARRRAVPWVAAAVGHAWLLDGVSIEVLAPLPGESPQSRSESNAASVVLAVRYGGFDALLMGDAPTEVERAVLARLPRAPSGTSGEGVELLKVGHHGSDTSTDSVFLFTLMPETSVLSVGRGNRYGHPTPRVMARLEASGTRIWRTDEVGTVRVRVRRSGAYTVDGARRRR
ncbi:MAG: MBL fold metallo-hydrolase, partial [Gemmatimonadota bacterium]|nr:MBL fold metallo-hydrolase [Gemmatimonadota bacterium]